MKHYCILLLPEFSNLCLANTVEPLRAANSFATEKLYRWSLVSVDGQPVESSSGFVIPAQSTLDQLLEETTPDALFVMSSYNYQRHTTPEVVDTLKRNRNRLPIIGGLDAGSYALAKAGLLNGYRATIHWAELEPFSESFRKIEVCGNRYIIDRNRITAGGATTALDLMLTLIRMDHGNTIAMAVSDLLIFDTQRPESTQQKEHLPLRMEETFPRLSRAIKIMEKNIEAPLSIAKIARLSGSSQRQLERDFKDKLDTTAIRYYSSLRALAARRLVTETALSVTEVAVRTGFSSQSALVRTYKSFYKCTPSEERKPFRAYRSKSPE